MLSLPVRSLCTTFSIWQCEEKGSVIDAIQGACGVFLTAASMTSLNSGQAPRLRPADLQASTTSAGMAAPFASSNFTTKLLNYFLGCSIFGFSPVSLFPQARLRWH